MYPSPKFFQKVQYCNTLSELARYIPLTQIDIPPAVYQWVAFLRIFFHSLTLLYSENLKHETGVTLPVQPLTSHFGVPLDELMGTYGEKGGVPRVVRDCVTYLREFGETIEWIGSLSPHAPISGIEEVGLFRRSPKSLTLTQVQAAYDRGEHPRHLWSLFELNYVYRTSGKFGDIW